MNAQNALPAFPWLGPVDLFDLLFLGFEHPAVQVHRDGLVCFAQDVPRELVHALTPIESLHGVPTRISWWAVSVALDTIVLSMSFGTW